MQNYTLKFVGLSPYSQNRHYDENVVPKLEKESPEDYEVRTWRNRMHTDKEGRVFIPPMALKNSLADIASYLSIKIKGKQNHTYTKHFKAGVGPADPIILKDSAGREILAKDVPAESLFVPSNGVSGSGKRVTKYFPVIHDWQGELELNVFDETITEPILKQHLHEAGMLIGLGRFRPQRNGYYGRFKVTELVAA